MARTYPSSVRGFSLIEVMVAMVIGLITVVIIVQVLSASEGQRRTISSGSDANTSGTLAMQAMQRDLMDAGFGISVDTNLFTVCFGRQVLGYNSTRAPQDITLPAAAFAPLSIFAGNAPPAYLAAPDADTDIVQIAYSGSGSFIGRGVPLLAQGSADTAFAVDILQTGSRAGLFQGDLVMAAQPSRDCVLSQITSIGTGGTGQCGETPAGTDTQMIHTTGSFRNPYASCNTETAIWNKPGSPNREVSFDGTQAGNDTPRLYSLGPPNRLVFRAYAVRNGRLTSCSPLFQNCANAAAWNLVADGIVSLRAEYGYDADGSGTVAAGEWTRNLPANPVWVRLRAARFVVVARSQHAENIQAGAVTTDCTPDWAGNVNANPTCTGAAQAGEVFLRTTSDGALWDRYRYKVYETTVPLRNMYWSNNL
jgi:type IV pilus assembly protein PilW